MSVWDLASVRDLAFISTNYLDSQPVPGTWQLYRNQFLTEVLRYYATYRLLLVINGCENLLHCEQAG